MSITQDQFNVLLSRIEILEDEIKKLKSKQIPKTKLKKERSLRHTDKEFDTYIKEYIHMKYFASKHMIELYTGIAEWCDTPNVERYYVTGTPCTKQSTVGTTTGYVPGIIYNRRRRCCQQNGIASIPH